MYKIEWKKKAKKSLDKIPSDIASRIRDKITKLSTNPRPADCEKLEGYEDAYRLRQGDYRIIYTIEDDTLVITVIKIAPRGDVYKKL